MLRLQAGYMHLQFVLVLSVTATDLIGWRGCASLLIALISMQVLTIDPISSY